MTKKRNDSEKNKATKTIDTRVVVSAHVFAPSLSVLRSFSSFPSSFLFLLASFNFPFFLIFILLLLLLLPLEERGKLVSIVHPARISGR